MTTEMNVSYGSRVKAKRTGGPVWLSGIAAALLIVSPVSHGIEELTSYAFVRDDATLDVAGRHIRLYGIHIPETGRVCESRIRPVRCGSRAAQALRFKIRGFVTCRLGGKYTDGSVAAYCRNDDVDLGAYLIERGWAMALPDAPFAYHARERIARHRGFGVWGFSIDAVETFP